MQNLAVAVGSLGGKVLGGDFSVNPLGHGFGRDGFEVGNLQGVGRTVGSGQFEAQLGGDFAE